ncbi:F-ATPase family transporter: protons (mitochondrial) [Ostreococcus lucimarinus CCE9901]|uniref:F-ATPase family transporter: protons (Mitochondrial) n=1 Tax=Ostreococcus lucimarinus (strain CCE9901) TaxID=436017 RepID=A4S063_OSTLU|nr:F-ATPase family transporter: protons (mitochondrial) [Ostreococcus lucimarinus CCE9901]ABO96981.1 F-ATPase family transporter: protons (mitochondrial) [Ostreococcus lucimarinus CCE9901]|eukprot:XP_001418688.1 F-ATPase family transporter: protons (mitochondrial) [Ostreococcus lucimarinus CCE9901]
MSAAAKNSAAYWRIAGMSYLKYANACGEVVRQSLKEPFLTQAKARETVYYKMTKYAEGKAGQSVITEVLPK